MRKRYTFTPDKIALLLPILLALGAPSVMAAEIWSEPTTTEQWSESGQAGQSEQSDREDAAIPSSIYIKLQIDSKQAVIQSQHQMLDVSPITVKGKTMIPFRFLGDALQADVKWNSKEQKVTMSYKAKTVRLIVGQSSALVNDKEVKLDAPPLLRDGRVLIPLRFVVEKMGLYVKYTALSKTIEISDQPISQQGEQPELPSDSAKQTNADAASLYGTWNIWTPGSATNLYFKESGDYATHEYTKGAEQGTVIINSDGSYSMKHAIWGEAKGKWRLTDSGEINGEDVQGIVLLDGASNSDWAVAPSENGKIRLLYSDGTWADGSAAWTIDSELYKK